MDDELLDRKVGRYRLREPDSGSHVRIKDYTIETEGIIMFYIRKS
jgi:hypothetical protein